MNMMIKNVKSAEQNRKTASAVLNKQVSKMI